jgi:hypothetical protein
MQNPSASDPSFKAFLEKLQEQNNRGFATQLVQLKAEREIAGEDNDKREEQLDDVISSLKEVRLAVTGIKVDIDLTPLVNIGENQTKLLEEISKESSLTRKLTEGSVEYDKEAAQYRNTSGRDIESKVSGKTSKDGGFIDFETARDTLSGQGKRVREDNTFSLKPINYTPGKTVAAAVGAKNEKEDKEEVDNFDPSLMGRLKSFMTDGESDKPGYGIFQKPPTEVIKKDREAKVSSPRQENPEADNVTSTGEIQADAAKSDLELSKEMLDTTKAQLIELKAIREALAPSTPRELTEQKSAPSSTNEKETEGGGSLLGSLASGAMDLIGGEKKAAGKVAGKAASIGGKLAKFATSNTGKVLGSVAAVGLGAYTAYEGYTAAEDSKQAKMEEVQAKVDSGQIKPEEAAAARKEIGNTATVEKSGAVGEGTGMAAGAIAGASLGATIGSIVPGVGTAIGGLAGGAIGAFAGSKAGKAVGEYGGKAINAVGSLFGGNTDTPVAKAETAVSSDSDLEALQAQRDKLAKRGPATDSPQSIKAHEQVLNTLDKAIEDKKSKSTEGESRGAYSVRVSKSDAHKKKTKEEKYDSELVEGLQAQRDRVAEKGPATDSPQSAMAHKNLLGTLDKAIEDKKSKPREDKLSKATSVTPIGGETNSKINNLEAEATKLGIDPNKARGTYEGGALTKITDEVSGKEYPIAVPEESKARVQAARNLKGTGSEVAQTSTENADMSREANKGGANNTVVSNNVSSNNTTKIVPMKANPRPEYTGSALDRYTSRIAVY